MTFRAPTPRPWLAALGGLILGLISACCDPREPPPEGVREISVPAPAEVSGVAAVPGGYLVVGDETHDHGRIWPGGARWDFKTPVGDAESVDVAYGPRGAELWLLLDEDGRRLIDRRGGSFQLPKRYKEVRGRGLEGLAVRWHQNRWQVAVLWEGGFYKLKKGADKTGKSTKPRVAILTWRRGHGASAIDREFELDVQAPAAGKRFRAPDLVWHGERLLVLLGSMAEGGGGFDHTWLQKFTLDGRRVGPPLKLELAWKSYRSGKNWEALDWTLDGKKLIIGYDAKGTSELVIFAYPGPGSR